MRATLSRPSAVLCALVLTAMFATPTRAQILREDFWVPDGTVNGIAVANGAVHVAGDFTQVGPPIGGFVGLDAATAATQVPFAEVAGTVQAIVSDGAGGWYIGGTFVAVRGQPRLHLAHLDAAGDVTAWNPGANLEVLTLARDAATGVVYAGGRFTSVGGAPRQAVAAVDSSGAVRPWDAGIASGAVNALAFVGGTVYAGGTFSTVAGQTRHRAAAFDAATGALTAWNPDVDSDVRAVAILVTAGFPSTVTVYLGGIFQNVGGQPRARLAAVDGTSGALTAWNPGASGSVDAITVSVGSNPITNPPRIYVGGAFQTVGGAARNRIAQLDESGAVAAWNPDASERVRALRAVGNLIYAGGEFTSIGGQPLRFVAALDRTTGAPTSWNPRIGGFVRALAATGATVFAGGEFCTAGGVSRRNLAALSLTSGQPTAWNPGTDAPVEAIETDGTTLYQAGSFMEVAGQPRSRLAAVDLGTGALGPWNPGADATVSELALSAGVIYAAGTFSTIGGQPLARLAAIDVSSGVPTAWNPGTTGNVFALLASGPWVYVGGSFTSLGGQTRVGIGRVDAVTGALSTWNPNASNFAMTILAMAIVGPDVYVGGAFSEMGGRSRDNLAIVDATTAAATAWDPYTDRTVYTLAVDGATAYVGGSFGALEGTRRAGLGAISSSTGLLSPWNPPIPGGTRLVKSHQGLLFVAPVTSYLSPHGSFAVLTDATTGVSDVSSALRTTHVSATPNPFRSHVDLRFERSGSGDSEVTIHDVTGRRVRRLVGGAADAGAHRVTWDGRDDSGERVAAGIYWARVSTGARNVTAKLLRVE